MDAAGSASMVIRGDPLLQVPDQLHRREAGLKPAFEDVGIAENLVIEDKNALSSKPS